MVSHRDTQKSIGAGSVTVTKPTGTTDGDLLVATILSLGTVGVLAGWTSIRETNISSVVFMRTLYKVAASEGASYTFTGATSTLGLVSAYTGVGALDVENGQSNASSTNMTAPSVTTTQDHDLLIWSGYSNGAAATVTPPSGFTEPTNGEQAPVIETSYLINAGSAGATGTKVGTSSVAGSSICHLVAFKDDGVYETGTVSIGSAAGSGLSVTGNSGTKGTATVGQSDGDGLFTTGSVSSPSSVSIGSAAGSGLSVSAGSGTTGSVAVGESEGSGLTSSSEPGTGSAANVIVGDAIGRGLSVSAGTGITGTVSVGTSVGEGLIVGGYANLRAMALTVISREFPHLSASSLQKMSDAEVAVITEFVRGLSSVSNASAGGISTIPHIRGTLTSHSG